MFAPIRQTAAKVCEIGVLKGASVKMWADYFPKAVVYGIDINDTTQHESERIHTFKGDQASRPRLQAFVNAHGGDFDIILDDGGHTCEQQQVSFGCLFKHVKAGGCYIIEDVDHGTYDRGKQLFPQPEGSTLTMVFAWIKTMKIESKHMSDDERKYIAENTAYCNVFRRANNDASCFVLWRRK